MIKETLYYKDNYLTTLIEASIEEVDGKVVINSSSTPRFNTITDCIQIEFYANIGSNSRRPVPPSAPAYAQDEPQHGDGPIRKPQGW